MHLYFIVKRFLGETFLPTRVCFDLDDRQYRHSCTSLPSPEIPSVLIAWSSTGSTGTTPPPPGLLIVTDTSSMPKKSIDSGLL